MTGRCKNGFRQAEMFELYFKEKEGVMNSKKEEDLPSELMGNCEWRDIVTQMKNAVNEQRVQVVVWQKGTFRAWLWRTLSVVLRNRTSVFGKSKLLKHHVWSLEKSHWNRMKCERITTWGKDDKRRQRKTEHVLLV